MTKHWLDATQFCSKPGQISLLPNEQGHLARVILLLGSGDDFWSFGGFPTMLPLGNYHYEGLPDSLHQDVTLAWGLGAYNFHRYKKRPQNRFLNYF